MFVPLRGNVDAVGVESVFITLGLTMGDELTAPTNGDYVVAVFKTLATQLIYLPIGVMGHLVPLSVNTVHYRTP